MSSPAQWGMGAGGNKGHHCSSNVDRERRAPSSQILSRAGVASPARVTVCKHGSWPGAQAADLGRGSRREGLSGPSTA
eukprot:6332763-Alexandrium_andersonii.AAC.1